MEDRKITIVEADDWTGVYVDGKLKYENDHVDLKSVLKALGLTSEVKYADLEWFCEKGILPKKLEKCKFEE